MKEMTILCDNCGKRLNGIPHIALGLREGSGMSDGEIVENDGAKYDPMDDIRKYIDKDGDINKFSTPYRPSKRGNPGNVTWYVQSFKGIDNELAFCDSKCLAKFFENKESELKLDGLAK